MNSDDMTSFAWALPAESLSNNEAEIQALEVTRLVALAENNVEAVGQLMADDLVHVHATGAVQNKAEYLAQLAELPRTTQRTSLSVRTYGEVAVLTGQVVNTIKRAPHMPAESIPMAVTQVAHRQAGRWTFVSFHATRLSTPA